MIAAAVVIVVVIIVLLLAVYGNSSDGLRMNQTYTMEIVSSAGDLRRPLDINVHTGFVCAHVPASAIQSV